MATIKYRPEIDGLRAFAIFPVVLFNMGFRYAAGGFIGVDVFFVISGYLATSIVLTDHDKGVFSFHRFWLQRIKRLFPSLLVMVIATSIAGYFMLFGGEINDLGKQGISAILLSANITMWRLAGDYWGAHVSNAVFLHTWALSVIEQFYLIYPFLLVFLLKFARKWVLTGTLIVAAISFLLYLWGSQYHPTAAFYLLPARVWEFAGGCLVAMVAWRDHLRISRYASSLLPLIGFVALILSYVFISGEEGFRTYIVIPVIGSVFIIAVSTRNSVINRILSLPPVVYAGKISFSLYLWHWPIFVLARQAQLGNKLGSIPTSVVIIVIAAVSVASYHLVEKTTRYKNRVLTSVCFGIVISLGLLFLLYASDQHRRYDISVYGKVAWDGQRYNVNPRDTWPDATKKRMEGIAIAARDRSNANSYATGGIIRTYGQPTPEIVVIGDSHALMWSAVIDTIAKELGVTVSFYAADGTPPFFHIPLQKSTEPFLFFTSEEKYLFDRKRLHFMQEWKPKIVIIVARWSHVRDIGITMDLVRFIGEIGSKILLIEQPPMLFFGDKNTPEYLAFLGMTPKEGQRQYIRTAQDREYELGRRLIRTLSRKYPYCEYLPMADIFLDDRHGAWVLDGSRVLYINDDHLSQDGASRGKDRIYDRIRDVMGRSRPLVGQLSPPLGMTATPPAQSPELSSSRLLGPR
jgi:peptidoglycan/LPS O-acetylase OafA/YrhL